ncbi:unnamed protein product [Durusdinium trenchii]|uniref:Exostosin GT47 domain-containing protein n=2 Tax=Durusdinium trenchii TaxID=1381693 RepID=A0ABP0ITB2_9DINO
MACPRTCRRSIAVSVVFLLSVVLAISLNSKIATSKSFTRPLLTLVHSRDPVRTTTQATQDDIDSQMTHDEVSENWTAWSFESSEQNLDPSPDRGTSPVPDTIHSTTGAPVMVNVPSHAEAFCRCAQLGGTTPPEGLENWAEVELQKLLKEMRERLRLYIYPTDFHCDQRRPKNTNRGYMAEWNFYDRARKSSLRVQDPENASIYYIPTFTSCWRSQGRSRGEGGQQAGKRMQQMLKDVASNFPFFQRNHGQRHIWVSAHDMGKAEPLLVGCKQNTGPSLCSDAALSLTEMLAKNSSALVNTADDAEHTKLESFAAYGFNRHLDVPLVCNGDTSFASRGARVPLTGRPRKNSVFFAGRWDQNYVPVRFIAIRSIMEAKLHKPTSFNKKIGPQAYERSLAESDLCLAPRGSRVWSPRLFEMIWFGCIPVIIASGYHLPASCFFDWREFSIFIEDKDAHKAGQILKTYLDDPKRLEQMRRKVFRIRKTFMWHDEDTNGDAFELALLDVYLKQQRQCG